MDLQIEEKKGKHTVLNFIYFITIIIIFAFSNIRSLSVMIQFIFVGVILLEIVKKQKIKLTIHFYWMTTFIIWGTFISLFAVDSALSIQTIINIALKFCLYTAIIKYVDTEYKVKKSLQYIVIGAVVLIIRLLLVTPLSVWGTDRLGVPLDLNPNIIGLVLGYASIATMYLGKKLKRKKYYLLLIPFIMIALFTGSRKSFLLIILGISSIVLLETKEKRRFIFNTFLLLIFSVILYYLVMNLPMLYNIIGHRLEGVGLFSGEMNASTDTRFTMISEGLILFKDRPILGYGLENFRLLSIYGTYSHNNYIEILVSSGIVGLLIYYSLPIYLLFSSLLKNRRNKKYSIIIVLLGMVLVMDFALVSYSQLITQIIIAICISYYLILYKST